jgi:hypothetical protein
MAETGRRDSLERIGEKGRCRLSPGLAHFIHIPKTGGHTLEAIFERQYGEAGVFYSRWGRQYGGPSEGPVGIFLKSRETRTPGRFYYPEHLPDFANRFLAATLEEKTRTRLLYGKNLEWGLGDLVKRDLKVFTVLRDPVDRVLSQYFFTVDFAEKPADLSLYEHIAAHVQPNIQTRLLSGPHGLSPLPSGPIMLARAKENLRSCCAFGLTERFGETVLLLARALGWEEVGYERRKVNKTRPKMTDIPRGVLRDLAADNSLDVALYRFAGKLFEERLAAYGPGLEEDMALLGRRNLVFRAAARSTRAHPPGRTR